VLKESEEAFWCSVVWTIASDFVAPPKVLNGFSSVCTFSGLAMAFGSLSVLVEVSAGWKLWWVRIAVVDGATIFFSSQSMAPDERCTIRNAPLEGFGVDEKVEVMVSLGGG